MTDEEIQSALGAQPKPTETPMHTRPASEVVGCSDQDALAWARRWSLIDADGMLQCGHCSQVTDWHVSLHCEPCRLSAPDRKREQDRIERERRRPLPEQSRPIQRVANRSFRDDY